VISKFGKGGASKILMNFNEVARVVSYGSEKNPAGFASLQKRENKPPIELCTSLS
jgi:hypothetical protein